MSEQHGKFGKDRHFELTKKALLHVIDRYWETFGIIQVENHEIYMNAHVLGVGTLSDSIRGEYTLHPDIFVVIKEPSKPKIPTSYDYGNISKAIIVECETTNDGLLKDELRMTAYKLLRMKTPDRNKLMMYVALPMDFKGKVEKPDCFNDFLFFEIEAS